LNHQAERDAEYAKRKREAAKYMAEADAASSVQI